MYIKQEIKDLKEHLGDLRDIFFEMRDNLKEHKYSFEPHTTWKPVLKIVEKALKKYKPGEVCKITINSGYLIIETAYAFEEFEKRRSKK